MLADAVTNRRAAFHTPALSSIGLDGAPQSRVVVLRKFAPESRELFCHTDRRAPKIAEIEKDARINWLFYDYPEKIQLKIRALAKIHSDDALAEERWQKSKPFSRRCYCGATPGLLLDAAGSGLPDFLNEREPTEAETNELGRQNFAVVSSQILEIDCLELYFTGNRRTIFSWNESGEPQARFVAP